MPILPTVKIKRAASASGYALINEADFDPDEHERFGAEEAPDKAPVEASEEADPEPEVDVEDYATGNGWYAIPGHDKKVRKDEAEQLLAEDGEKLPEPVDPYIPTPDRA